MREPSFTRRLLVWIITVLGLVIIGTCMLMLQAPETGDSHRRPMNKNDAPPASVPARPAPRNQAVDIPKTEVAEQPTRQNGKVEITADFVPRHIPESFKGAKVLAHRALPARDKDHARRAYI